MIVQTRFIAAANASEFKEKLHEAIEDMQRDRLEVEVQYHPMLDKDENTYIVFTVLVIGRKK